MRLHPEEPAAGPWSVRAVSAVVSDLVAFAGGAPLGRPFVLAIDGRSANGKTTLSRKIDRTTPQSVVVHTDDVAWRHSIFGWDDLLVRGILEPARRGEAVAYRPPAWDDHAREGSIDVAAGTKLVVVEGVGAGRRELMPFVDAVIWVQSDLAESERRDAERIAAGEASASLYPVWMAEEVPFQAAQRPWERATVIVCGTPDLPHNPESEAVVAPGPRLAF
jgi:hypothetical protein